MSDLVGRLRAAGCVYAEDEAALLTSEGFTAEALEAAVRRREAGEPLEQILGWVDFAGVRIRLLPGVFVPRQRSSLLVAEAVCRLPPVSIRPPSTRSPVRTPVLVDLGCGSGALGAAVSSRRHDVEVWATDVDPTAVECARLNLPVDRVLRGDHFSALPVVLRADVDVVVANLPYVPSDAVAMMPPEARDHEHRTALDGGPDGLDQHRRMLAEVGAWLRPGGCVLVECGAGQVEALTVLMLDAGLTVEVAADDETGGRVVIGTRPATVRC